MTTEQDNCSVCQRPLVIRRRRRGLCLKCYNRIASQRRRKADPERHRVTDRAWRQANRTRMNALRRKHAQERRKDPVFLEKLRAYQRALFHKLKRDPVWYTKTKTKQLVNLRKRMAANPELRIRKNARAREAHKRLIADPVRHAALRARERARRATRATQVNARKRERYAAKRTVNNS